MLKLRKYIPVTAIMAIIAIVSFAILAPIVLHCSWPKSHDDLRYIYIFDQFRQTFMRGFLYPRWLPDVYGGYGAPLFIFYQPGFFYAALFFSFFFSNVLTVMYWTLFTFIFIGGLGAFFLTRKISNNLTGLFCAVLFLLTPYLYVDLYVRGDLSELAAMMLCPWPFFFLLRLKDRIVKKEKIGLPIAVLGISVSGIIICHPAVSLFFMPTFCLTAVYFLLSVRREKRIKFFLATAAAVFLSLTITSPYWFTAFEMKKYSHYERAVRGYFSAESHVVGFSQFFSRKWGFGDSKIGEKDEMPFQLGLAHFILALTGFILKRKNRFIQAVFGIYIALILFMSPLAFFLWKHISLIRYAQFPWRILSVTATLQCICAAGLAKIAAGHPRRRYIQTGIFLAIIAVCIAWNGNQFAPNEIPNSISEKMIKEERLIRTSRFYTYQVTNEMHPRTSIMPIDKARGSTPLIQVSSAKCSIKKLTDCTPNFIHFELSTLQPMKILINQLYFPGQQIILNGRPLSNVQIDKAITQDGRTFIDIPKGAKQELTVFYKGPPGWLIRNILIGMVLIAYIILIYWEHQKKQQTGNSHG